MITRFLIWINLRMFSNLAKRLSNDGLREAIGLYERKVTELEAEGKTGDASAHRRMLAKLLSENYRRGLGRP